MVYKIVGADENSLFPIRVENRLSAKIVDSIHSRAKHISVMDYGAIGDGVANDLPAIQSAIDATTPGDIVIFPPGDYGIADERIRVKEGVTLRGYGATIHRLVGTTMGTMLVNFPITQLNTPGYEGWGNITIEGITFNAHGDIITNRQANIFIIDHARNIRIIDCTFLNVSAFHPVEITGVDGAIIENCRFFGYGSIPNVGTESEAIQIDSTNPGNSGLPDKTMTKNVIISNCQIGPSAELPSFPKGIGSHNSGDGSKYSNIKIIGNVIEGTTIYGIDADEWRDSLVSGNVIKNMGVNCQGINGDGSVGLKITDNSIYGQGETHNVSGINTGDNSSYITVANNFISNTKQGINANPGTVNAVIEGNMIANVFDPAIVINGGVNILISNNNALNIGGSANSCIRLTDAGGTAPTDCSIVGNRMRNTVGSPGVSAVPAAVNLWVFGNDFRGASAIISGNANQDSNRI